MSFLDKIDAAKAYVEKNGRVSLLVLQLEFDLDDARLLYVEMGATAQVERLAQELR